MRHFKYAILGLVLFLYPWSMTQAQTLFSPLTRNTSHPPKNTQNHNYEHLRLSGLILFETIVSNYDQTSSRFGSKQHFSTFCQPRTNLFIEARPNPWVTGHFNLAFRGTCGYGAQNDEGRFRKYPRPLEEAVIKFGHHNQPWYMSGGITYLPYGQYERHMIPATFTQLLSQSQAVAAEVGYSDQSLTMAGYVFRGAETKNNLSNGGLRLGYQLPTQSMGRWQIIADWIYDMPTAVNFIAYKRSGTGTEPGFTRRASGTTLTLKHSQGRWSQSIQYATALKRFDVTPTTLDKPSALSIATTFQHHLKGIPATFGLSAHKSFRARLVGPSGLPLYRLHGYWQLTPWQYLATGLHVVCDKDYGTKSGGTGRKSITGLVTAKVFFT